MNRAAKVILFLFFLLIASVAVAGYFFWQYRQTKELAANPTQAEVERVVNLVAQHVVLPEGETPTVATVTSVEELQDQPFFKNAQNGYQVLVYQQTGLAVLYDPNNDRVVNMAQINPVPVESTDVMPEAPVEEEETPTSIEDVSAQQTDETVVQ